MTPPPYGLVLTGGGKTAAIAGPSGQRPGHRHGDPLGSESQASTMTAMHGHRQG